MNLLSAYISVFAIVVTTKLQYSFAYSQTTPAEYEITSASSKADSNIPILPTARTFLTQSSEKSVEKFNNQLTVAKAGRNLQFPSFHEDVLQLAPAPIQSNFDILPEYQQPILDIGPAFPSFESHPLHFDDTIDVDPFSHTALPPPTDNFKIIYPLDVGEGVAAPTGRQIVFRPLFAYRRQKAQRRRVYSKPSASSTSYYSYGQRRQGYPYRYSSYSYPQYYPSYYHNAQYDYVS